MNNGENNFLYYLFSLLLMDVHLFFSFLLLQTNYRCVRSLLLSGSDSRFKRLNFHIFAIFLFLYRKQFIPNLALCNSIFIFFLHRILFSNCYILVFHTKESFVTFLWIWCMLVWLCIILSLVRFVSHIDVEIYFNK